MKVMPSRYQWSRKAGARLPEGVVTCCRPGKWGNPFKVVMGDDRMWYVVDIDGSIEYAFRDILRENREMKAELARLRGEVVVDGADHPF